jgi:xanthine/uracil permease
MPKPYEIEDVRTCAEDALRDLYMNTSFHATMLSVMIGLIVTCIFNKDYMVALAIIALTVPATGVFIALFKVDLKRVGQTHWFKGCEYR